MTVQTEATIITRFRIEAKGKTKNSVYKALLKTARAIIAMEKKQGKWDITDEAITGTPGNYIGRIVVKLEE